MNAPAGRMDVPDEALELLQRESECVFPGARCTRFEFSSRGDRVPGTLLAPALGQSAPLVLLQPGDVERRASEFAAPVSDWLTAGAAIASIDLPLHGERASSKLTERLSSGLGRSAGAADAVWELLWREFLRQAVVDLRRELDALGELGGVSGGRIVCAGTGLGAVATAAFCAVDPRPRAAALAAGSAPLGAAESAACTALAQFAPRPLLLVDTGDAAKAFAKAAAGPVSSVSAAGAEPEDALRAMTPFVLNQLGLADESGG